jgi:hypothetical protein
MYVTYLFVGLIVLAGVRSFRSTDTALALLVCMFGIENLLQSKDAYFINHSSHANLAIGVVVVIASLNAIRGYGLRPVLGNPLVVLSWVIYLIGFASFSWTLSPDVFIERWIPTIPYFITYLVLGPFLFLGKNTVQSGMRWVLVIGVTVLIIMAFFSTWGGRAITFAQPMLIDGRLLLEAYPLAIAGFASTVGIIAILVDWKIPAIIVLRVLVYCIALYVILLTQSRGQAIALVAVSTLAFTAKSGRLDVSQFVQTSIVVILIAMVMNYAISFVVTDRWNSSSMDAALAYRETASRYLLEDWSASGAVPFFFGLGANSSFALAGDYCHNLPVEMLVEFGVFGALLYISFYIQISRVALPGLFGKTLNIDSRNSLLCMLSLFLVSTGLSFKSGSLDGWHELFFYGIGVQASVLGFSRRSTIVEPSTGDKRSAGGLTAAPHAP